MSSQATVVQTFILVQSLAMGIARFIWSYKILKTTLTINTETLNDKYMIKPRFDEFQSGRSKWIRETTVWIGLEHVRYSVIRRKWPYILGFLEIIDS